MGEVVSFAGKTLGIDSQSLRMPQGMTFEAGIDAETQESNSDKPLTWRKGTKLEAVSFEVLLDAANGVIPRKEFEEWREIMNQREPHPLSVGGRPYINNKMLLKEVGASEIQTMGDGKILKMLLKLTFEEYVQEGKKQASGGSANAVNVNLSDSLIELLGLNTKSAAAAMPEPPTTKTGMRKQTMSLLKDYRSGDLLGGYNSRVGTVNKGR